MNKQIILVSLVILPFVASPQNTETVRTSTSTKGIILDVSPGMSLPVGAYAMSDAANTQSGFSRTGLAVQLSCDWMGKKDFGVGLQYTFQLNPLKNNSNDLILSGMSVPLGSGDWTNHYIMGGPVFMKYIGRLLIEAKALIGVIISTSPLFKTQDPAFKTVSGNTGTGFAFNFSAGAGYRISPKVALKVNAGYLIGTPKIDRQYGAQIIGYRDSAFVYSPPVNFNTKKVVSAFNLGIGIIIKIAD
jgi:opacity protein-like surface antigen